MMSRAALSSALPAVGLALLLVAGCDTTGPGVGEPATLVAAPIPDGLVIGETITVAVTVRDAETRPVPGVPVAWAPSSGTTADPEDNATNQSGVAFTSWSLGTEAGEHTLVVRAAGMELTLTATTRSEP